MTGLIPLTVLLVLAVVARWLQGCWLAPSAFAGLLWFLYILVPLLALDDPVSSSSIWLLVGLVACMQAGAFIAEDPTALRHGRGDRQPSTTTLGDRFLSLSLQLALVALLGSLAYIASWLGSLDLEFSLEGFLSLGAIMYGVLLDGESDPWWFRLTRMWIFPSALLGGFAAALVQSRVKKWLTVSAFLPALVAGAAIASRFGTALAISCWLGGYMAMKCYATQGRYRVRGKAALAVLLLSVGAAAMYSALGVLRGHKLEDLPETSVMLRANLLGHVAVFDAWVKAGGQDRLTCGTHTFAGLFELSGLGRREPALDYQEVVLESGNWSNIYTAFRGLIGDFSLVGAVFLCLVAGILAGHAYTRLCAGSLTSLWLLAAYYIFLIWSPIVSAFNYNAVLLALLVGALYVRRYLSPAFRFVSGHRV